MFAPLGRPLVLASAWVQLTPLSVERNSPGVPVAGNVEKSVSASVAASSVLAPIFSTSFTRRSRRPAFLPRNAAALASADSK